MNQCDKCPRSFDTSQGLGMHRIRTHGLDADHGTVARYLKHRREDERACHACRVAWAKYARQRLRKKK